MSHANPLRLASADRLRPAVVRITATGLLALACACHAARPSASVPEPVPVVAAVAEAPRAAVPDVAAVPPPTARTTASGVAIHVLDPGDATAPTPRSGDVLELRYRVWDEDGRLVGASRPDRSERLATAWLPAGWAEAMYTLHVGAHAHVWVPAAQAYAALPNAPHGELRIDVYFVDLESTGVVDLADVPLTSPPENALRTASGVSFVVLRAGTGTRHAAREGRVTVHYEGWTADGERFDSSYARGQPATFPLAAVISGWQEAVPLMVEGEKTRFWIPGALAYGDGNMQGRPNGMLVFDIELIRIED